MRTDRQKEGRKEGVALTDRQVKRQKGQTEGRIHRTLQNFNQSDNKSYLNNNKFKWCINVHTLAYVYRRATHKTIKQLPAM